METSWLLEGIRCLSSNKNQTQQLWAFEAFKLIAQTQTHALNIEAGLRQKGIQRLSRERLKQMHENLELQLDYFKNLLRPLGWEAVAQNPHVSDLSHAPGNSFLASNFDNLFRDWVWGERENAEALRLLNQVTDANPIKNELMILGAGACRLAYDLHRNWNLSRTTAVDYNPLLLLVAKAVIGGQALNLIEFPIVPARAADFSVARTLSGPSPLKNGMEFILADLRDVQTELPKAQNILTPWLIDVVKIDLSSFVRKINGLLPIGGTWLNFGPLGFNNPLLSDYYSYEEVIHMIGKYGFEISQEIYQPVPYMQSPASNSHRIERVLCFAARKIAEVERAPQIETGALPWELDADEAIDIPIAHMRLRQGHEFNAHLCLLLESKPTFSQLIQQLVEKYKLPPDQLGYMVHQVLRGIHYQSLANPMAHD